ncbi:glutathione S-transferase LANCL1 isoform X1 [Diabrotica virgifera virgifera]|uniref:LanC-like protein 2 isoform X1 n=2 Tax=Diabrotica virgifera virgifera TaxID=50390 RepID=A0A6P7FHV2_DIAVI|nr:glutathione S-transferase LANCL1 isoform X1 [Diabrotica virgifera virgifera]
MIEMRFFNNPFEDYTPEGLQESKNKVSQSINVKWKSTMENLQTLDFSDYTVYTGTSGVALLKLLQDPDDFQNLKEVLKLLSLHKLKGRRHTFLCGDAGPLAIGIVVHSKLGNHDEVSQLISKLTLLNKDVLDIHSDVANEYMYGRIGYLYAILYVNKNISPPPFDDNYISQIIETILVIGRNISKAGRFKCPIMYDWHDSYYMGAAHGLAGILYLLLQARAYLTEDELNNVVKPTIDYLLTQRFPSGNFPSSIGRDSDKYVQWCHGSPGFVHLLTTAYKIFQDTRYLQAALECGEIIWQRGLLRKGYSLCHGVSGNAYSFLELYQTTKEEKHLYRALKFAEWCIAYKKEHEEHSPDRPKSLFEGIAGPMYFLLDIQNPMAAKFPGYTL